MRGREEGKKGEERTISQFNHATLNINVRSSPPTACIQRREVRSYSEGLPEDAFVILLLDLSLNGGDWGH